MKKLVWKRDGDVWKAGPFVIGPNVGQFYLELQPDGVCIVAGVPIRVAQQVAGRIASAIFDNVEGKK